GADALSLLQRFTNTAAESSARQFLHFRLGGNHLGNFEVFLNSDSDDQVVIGQVNRVNDMSFFDVWTAFPLKSARERGKRPAADGDRQCRILKYKISARILPPRELEADATLDVLANQSGIRTLFFELSRHLQLSAVTQDG